MTANQAPTVFIIRHGGYTYLAKGDDLTSHPMLAARYKTEASARKAVNHLQSRPAPHATWRRDLVIVPVPAAEFRTFVQLEAEIEALRKSYSAQATAIIRRIAELPTVTHTPKREVAHV